MPDTGNAVIAALRAKLVPALAPFGCPVVDYGAEDQAMPYCLFGRHTSDPDDTFTESYTIHRIVLEIYTGPNRNATGAVRGKAQCRSIVEAARAAVHHVRLTLSEGKCVRCQVERTNVDPGADVVTTEGSLIVRVDVAG